MEVNTSFFEYPHIKELFHFIILIGAGTFEHLHLRQFSILKVDVIYYLTYLNA